MIVVHEDTLERDLIGVDRTIDVLADSANCVGVKERGRGGSRGRSHCPLSPRHLHCHFSLFTPTKEGEKRIMNKKR